jgi:hypothetical protein
MMRLLESARSLYGVFSRLGEDIVATLGDLEAHYGDDSGLAHAAEVAQDKRAEFSELVALVKELLPSRSSTLPAASRTSARSRWARESFAPYQTVEDDLDRVLASRPSGDAGQGTSSGVVRDDSAASMPAPPPTDEPDPAIEERSPDVPERSSSPELGKSAGKRRAN